MATAPPIRLPDLTPQALDAGVMREPTAEADRLVLWRRGPCAADFQQWERISSVARADITCEHGLCSVPATAAPARQRLHGLFARLRQRWRAGGSSRLLLPNGLTAEPCGARQSGLLVWAEEAGLVLGETTLRQRWPSCERVLRLGSNLCFVALPAPAASEEPQAPSEAGSPREQAEQRLAAARAAQDRPAEVTALADLGVAYRRGGDPKEAIPLFEEALAAARRLGDAARQRDVLGNLGLAELADCRLAQALDRFGEELASARAAGDGFAEKAALDHLGLAHATRRGFSSAMHHYEQALALARKLGDWQHEADLLWYEAILHAEQGRRDDALACGQAAVAVYRRRGKPQARFLAEHLHTYRLDAAGAWPTPPAAAGPFPGAFIVAGSGPAPAAPTGGSGLLRMAIAALKSMAQFVGSGCQTVSAEARRQRLAVCGRCEYHTGLRCRLCGCFTTAKTWLPHEDCPLGRWPIRAG